MVLDEVRGYAPMGETFFNKPKDELLKRREAIRQQIDKTRSEEEKRERDVITARRTEYDSLPDSDRKEFDEEQIFGSGSI